MILGPDGNPVNTTSLSIGSDEVGFNYAFEAAQRVGYRGYFWFPGLDPTIQMPEWSRETVAQKVNWLYNNVGYIRAVIDGLSLDEVETGIWPKATSSNPFFNKASTDRFHDSWEDARFFDSRKIEDVYSAQFCIRRHIRLHGELFALLLRPSPGYVSARLHFIPFWQVRNCGPQVDRMTEGMVSDILGATVTYRVATGDGPEDFMDISADDMLHFHDEFLVGQKHGMSGLAPMARKLFTVDDIERALANGIQLRTLMAYAIERADTDTGGPTMLPGVSSVEEVDTPEGGKLVVQKILGANGREVTVADVPAGRKIKVLESNQAMEPMGFKKDVLTDLALCSKYPPDYVFSFASGAGGTDVRWKIDRVQTVKNSVRQFQLIPQFLRPAYRFRTWQDIKQGFYDGIEGGIPDDWWRMKAICPANTSVDQGRMGKLLDDRVATGKMSEDDYHGTQGHDSGDVDDAILAKREEREAKLDIMNAARAKKGKQPLAYEDIWPVNTQAVANRSQQTEPATGPLEDPPAQ